MHDSRAHEFRTLIDNATILMRIRELAREIGPEYPDVPPCVVAVMEGARMFGRHLLRNLPWNGLPTHEIRASSYGSGTESSGRVQLTGDAIDVTGRQVLLVEDIVDTGRTVARLADHFLDAGATDVRVVTLLSKPDRRAVDVVLDYVGFEIPNEFVIGFGMDFAGRYRELDRVAIYEETRAVGHG